MKYFALLVIQIAIFSPAVSAQDIVGRPGVSNAPATAPAVDPAAAAEFRGDILMARKEYVSAVEMYESALKISPNNATVLNKIGVAYQQLTGYDTAIEYYKRASKADKKLANPWNNLGTIEYQRERYGKAIGYYKRAIAMAPGSAALYSNLAMAYYSQKKYGLAMQTFSKALAIDPQFFDRHEGMGGSVLQQRSAPDPGTLNFFLAKTYAKAGDVERAARCLKLARDYGYKNFRSAEKDPDFAAVIKDQRIQDVLQNRPSFAGEDTTAGGPKPAPN